MQRGSTVAAAVGAHAIDARAQEHHVDADIQPQDDQDDRGQGAVNIGQLPGRANIIGEDRGENEPDNSRKQRPGQLIPHTAAAARHEGVDQHKSQDGQPEGRQRTEADQTVQPEKQMALGQPGQQAQRPMQQGAEVLAEQHDQQQPQKREGVHHCPQPVKHRASGAGGQLLQALLDGCHAAGRRHQCGNNGQRCHKGVGVLVHAGDKAGDGITNDRNIRQKTEKQLDYAVHRKARQGVDHHQQPHQQRKKRREQEKRGVPGVDRHVLGHVLLQQGDGGLQFFLHASTPGHRPRMALWISR